MYDVLDSNCGKSKMLKHMKICAQNKHYISLGACNDVFKRFRTKRLVDVLLILLLLLFAFSIIFQSHHSISTTTSTPYVFISTDMTTFIVDKIKLTSQVMLYLITTKNIHIVAVCNDDSYVKNAECFMPSNQTRHKNQSKIVRINSQTKIQNLNIMTKK